MRLKNIFIRSVAFCSLLMATSCEDFLVKDPLSLVEKSEAFANLDQAEVTLLGTYSSVGVPWSEAFVSIANTSDDVGVYEQTSYPFSNYAQSYTSTSKDIYALWKSCFKAICDANDCVKNIALIGVEKGDELRQKQLIGEARFLRAFIYFDMLQLFGSVPWHDKSFDSYNSESLSASLLRQSPPSYILKKIILDAEAAYAVLPETTDRGGRATKWAAATLLAKAYMLRAGNFIDPRSESQQAIGFYNSNSNERTAAWQNAAYYLSQIDGKFSLIELSGNAATDVNSPAERWAMSEKYGSLFLKSRRGEAAQEIIFDIQYQSPEKESKWGVMAIGGNNYQYGDYFYTSSSGITPTAEFALSYNTTDPRFYWNIASYTYSDGIQDKKANKIELWKTIKYRLESVNREQSALVYRYADVLLMLSEVANELGTSPFAAVTMNESELAPAISLRPAAEYLNEVRARVGQELITSSVDLQKTDGVNIDSQATPITDSQLDWELFQSMLNNISSTPRQVYYMRSSDGATTPSDRELFRRAMRMERAWELCYERHRWFDLKRWGLHSSSIKAIKEPTASIANINYKVGDGESADNYINDKSKMNILIANGDLFSKGYIQNYNECYRYLPIPFNEMAVNEYLKQNYGY